MRFLRNRFKNMTPYHSAYLTEGVILNSNESPYPAPKALNDYVKAHIDELLVNRYPDTDSWDLARAAAKVYGVKKENVTCGVGSDELIDCILSAIIDEDDQVMIPYPSFSMYSQFTDLNSGRNIKVPLTKDFTYDLEVFKEAIKKNQPKVIFLCNPNNPTGCILKPAEIKELLDLAEGLVVVDEAYAEFCEEEISMIPYINDYKNLVVLKTFSKAYALAGARVGYAIAHEEVIDLINTVKSPYNLNMFSQLVGTWAISHHEYALENAKKIIAERSGLDESLRLLGFKTYVSYSNFIWLEMPDYLFDALKEKKIYIRRMTVNDKFYYRITVGTPEENKQLIEGIKACMK